MEDKIVDSPKLLEARTNSSFGRSLDSATQICQPCSEPEFASGEKTRCETEFDRKSNLNEHKIEFEVLLGQEGQRLDKFLAQQISAFKPEITRSKIQQFLDKNLIEEIGKKPYSSSSNIASSPNPSAKTKLGQKFLFHFPAISPSKLSATEIPFEIVFEDEHLLIINKPAGLTVHPGAGNSDETLVNALLFSHGNQLSSVSGESRPGIVHRLDKDTSGLMLVAKNDLTHLRLSEMLARHEIKRNYLAFIYGVMPNLRGVISKNITRSRSNRLRMSVSKSEGRAATTFYETKTTYLDGFVSLVECRLQTGRTHQIRLHFESEKHSLVGDQAYARCRHFASKDIPFEVANVINNFPRQALHSFQIGFCHPITSKEINFQIDLPPDLKLLQQILTSEVNRR